MNNTDQLLIRACKSKDPAVRLRSVYRRFYCTTYAMSDEYYESCMVTVLASMLDKLGIKMSVSEAITRFYFLDRNATVLSRLIDVVRFKSKLDLPGYRAPAWARKI